MGELTVGTITVTYIKAALPLVLNRRATHVHKHAHSATIAKARALAAVAGPTW